MKIERIVIISLFFVTIVAIIALFADMPRILSGNVISGASFDAFACADEACEMIINATDVGSTIYLGYETGDNSIDTVIANATFPDGSNYAFEIPQMLEIQQVGTYTFEFTAFKNDGTSETLEKTLESSTTMSTIQSTTSTQRTTTTATTTIRRTTTTIIRNVSRACNNNGVCEEGENYACPKDCPIITFPFPISYTMIICIFILGILYLIASASSSKRYKYAD